ncbi:hypothetical protein RJT34_16525 [Clitoria ternatea]|uniref:Uncharacterized protein n=1 Tax=Clitoria ternatea TaxID=43366 RepID=A0AAN9J9C5_CLITE
MHASVVSLTPVSSRTHYSQANAYVPSQPRHLCVLTRHGRKDTHAFFWNSHAWSHHRALLRLDQRYDAGVMLLLDGLYTSTQLSSQLFWMYIATICTKFLRLVVVLQLLIVSPQHPRADFLIMVSGDNIRISFALAL